MAAATTKVPKNEKKCNKTHESKDNKEELVAEKQSSKMDAEETKPNQTNNAKPSNKKHLAIASEIVCPQSRNGTAPSPLPSINDLNIDNKSDMNDKLSNLNRQAIELTDAISNQNLFQDREDADNSNNIKVVIRVRPFNQREATDVANKSCVDI